MNSYTIRISKNVSLRFTEGKTETGEPIIIVRVLASNKEVDAYYTHMSEKTLQNFLRDALAGVTLLDSA